MSEATSAAPRERWQEQVIVWATGIAIAYGAFAQGGFYAGQFVNIGVAIVVAFIARLLLGWPRLDKWAAVSAIAFLTLGAWALVDAGIRTEVADGVPHAVVCLSIVMLIAALRGLTDEKRVDLQLIIITASVVVALSAWVGTITHNIDLAMPSQGLWRGASTLTYANAAAAFLVAPMIYCAVRSVTARNTVILTAALFALGLGWITTLSRGSFLALAVAVIVGLAIFPERRRLLSLWPLIPAWAVASVTVLPSLSESGTANASLAVLGAIAGLSIAIAGRHSGAGAKVVGGLIVVGAVAGTVRFGSSLSDVWDQIASTRLNAASSDRTDLLRVTWEQFVSAPWLGVGPRNLDFAYENSAGVMVQAVFTHNEYLQLAAELGVIGLTVFLVAVLAFVLHVVKERGSSREHLAVVVAALAAFAVHSSLDFLWHIPVLVFLTVVVTLAFTSASPARRQEFHEPQTTD